MAASMPSKRSHRPLGLSQRPLPTMSTLPISRPAVTFSINNPFPTSVRNIIVCHPNHHPQVVLFFCAALDYDPENSRYGCNHRLVLDACKIIANNRQGQLATLQHNEWNYVATDVPLLTPAQYYFIVENDPTLRYPIVTQFNAWKFPPEPPAHWGPIRGRINIATTGPLTSSVSEAVQHSDRACIITRTPIGMSSSGLWARPYSRSFGRRYMPVRLPFAEESSLLVLLQRPGSIQHRKGELYP